jgi:hypothetical protein
MATLALKAANERGEAPGWGQKARWILFQHGRTVSSLRGA